MKAEEKAKELIDRFKEFADEAYMDTKEQFELNEARTLNAKQCALIAVDEILNINSVDKDYDLSEYWLQVKSEIEKL